MVLAAQTPCVGPREATPGRASGEEKGSCPERASGWHPEVKQPQQDPKDAWVTLLGAYGPFSTLRLVWEEEAEQSPPSPAPSLLCVFPKSLPSLGLGLAC